MRFCILLLLYSGWAFSQTQTQGTWSADNDNPPGLEEARANNYEKNLRPPSKHPPAYYTADYYEYQVDRNVTFTSDPVNSSPEEESESSSPKKREEFKERKASRSYAGGGYVQGRRITSRNCTYTCNKKLPKVSKKGLIYDKTGTTSSTLSSTSWIRDAAKDFTKLMNSTPSPTKRAYKRSRRPSSTSYKRRSPRVRTRKYTAPVVTRTKHEKKPSISPTTEGSSLR